ncbi:MAG: S46 family peptidase [Marinifilaceae bacterium]
MKKLVVLACALLSYSAVKADEGMWLLSKIGNNMAKMNEMGLMLSEEDIYSVNKPGVKDAIVGFGREGRPFAHFCSGEIISGQGLVLTNHHCAFDAIQSHSSVEHNYLADGFWAYNQKDELANPGITASILDRMEDVTARVNGVLNDGMTTEQRNAAIDSISKVITKEATKGTKLNAQVQSMYEGNQFFLFVYNIYKDVRLVGAPPQSMGKFGGDTDNWMWPRHTADFAMFRIYTAPDGSPAPYSANNVPLKPKHHLPVSAKGVKDGDFAMILGFPGSTDRYTTSYGLRNTMDAKNEVRYRVRTEVLDVMRQGMESDPAVRIQYASKYARTANYWKYSNEQNKALRNLNTLGNKEQIEQQFTAWVNSDASRKAMYANVLPSIDQAYAGLESYAKVQTFVQEALGAPELPTFAFQTGRMLEKLADSEVTSEERERLKKQVLKRAGEFYKDFNADVERNMIGRLYQMYADSVSAEYYPESIKMVIKNYKGDYNRYAADAMKKSIFASEQALTAFVEKANMKTLDKDPIYRAGKSFFDMYFKMGSLTGESREIIEKGNRLFVRGLMEMEPNKAWSPNANSTIRITYGKVGSYKPRDAVFYDYYTTMDGIIEKEGPVGGEFEVPARLKELHAKKDFGPYGKETVVACFITDNDITGGNSGSGVINAKGELIGTAFDGNSEAMSGDIDFEENLQRCINIDTRYMLWIVDKYAGAKNLINEMTIVTE